MLHSVGTVPNKLWCYYVHQEAESSRFCIHDRMKSRDQGEGPADEVFYPANRRT